MASSSSSSQPKDRYYAFSGLEPQGIRRKVSESTRLFDVFINHRGPDSKQTLALPLYNSLKKLGIRAFLDLEEMELGHSFPSTIETAIRSAAVHIAIFSKRYAESPWCLAELVLMLQSPAKIIPVFYEVEPWALRHIEKGAYADAFIEYQKKSRYLDKLKQWKEALQSISFTTGYEMNNLSNSDCKSIVSAVQREVQRTKPLHVAKYPVALDKLVQDFERRCLHKLVQDFEIQCGMNEEEEGKAKIVGIFGMGGVGKTTLSKELFNRKRQQYARACFLFDVREASAKSNFSSLQMKLLKDLFDENGFSFQSREEGSSCISNCIERSNSLSFLIVLDDVDHPEQLDALSIGHMLKKSGNSLILITTRDVGVLIAEGIKVGYYLKGMDKDDARQLFSWHAFSQPHPAKEYEYLVEDFLGVCGGLPLSLQVLGRHVHGRDENYWRSELIKVGTTMHRDIQRKLKISFDALNTEEKQIFMDMACFFVDQLKCTAIRVWKASGWSAQNGLQTLIDKCLVEEIGDPLPVLRMHDHLRDLGREMANELSNPCRLWRPQDLKILESKGLENIFAQTEGRCFHSIFDKSLNSEVQFFLRESDDRAETSSSLIWLHLCYPYVSCRPHSSNLNLLRRQQHLNFSVQPKIPSWIPLQNMECLRISNGYFKRLWQQDAEAPSQMKELEIYGTFLEEFPDFLGISTNVEKEVNDDQHMSKMKLLMVNTRRRVSGSLQKIHGGKFKAQSSGGRKSDIVKAPFSLLEELVIREQENIIKIVINGNHCPSLKSLDLSSMENLNEVQFTKVEKLKCLKVSKCEYLKRLSVTSDFTELEELNISTCPELEEPNLGCLSCLKKIRIAYCNFKSVPGISSFSMLVELNINRCPKLHELSLAHLCCLEKVIIKDCDHLESVTGLSHLPKLVEVDISWCWMLQLELFLVGLNCLKRITVDKFVKAKCFELNGCKSLETVSGISFEMIRVVNICDCPELRELPVICSASCLESIAINGCRKLNNTTLAGCGILKRISGNFDPVGLSISDCPMLEELPCFERVTCLEDISILQCGNLQNVTLPTTLKRLDLNACRELKNILAISALPELVELNISECPQLELGVADMIWLEKLAIVNLKSVSGISNLIKLVELEISECLELEVELCLSNLSSLERIDIVQCGKMHTITLPTNLIKFSLEACRDLETVVGISGLTKLAELNIKKCPQLQLELHFSSLSPLKRITIIDCGNVYNIILPTTLIKLTVQRCRKLQTVAAVGDLTKLTELCIRKCPELKELPVICGASCLERITIDGCSKLNRLQVTDCRFLREVSGLQFCISDCPELEEICIFRCEKLQKITLPTTLKSLQLDACKDLKSVSEISYLKNLVQLIIIRCWQLELDLGLHLEGMDSLQNIKIDGCGKLVLNKCKNLNGVSLSCNFDEAWLSVCDCSELVLPNLARMNCWESITIVSCEKLQKITLSTTIRKLTVQRCRELKTMAGIGNLTKLTELYISECPALEELPSFAGLCCLERISIDSCEKLHTITLPTSLMKLTLQACKELETIAGISGLTKLVELNIRQCSELQPGLHLSSLNCLKRISIVECWNMHSITLPITLMELTVQRCRELQRVAGIGYLTELTDLYISECEELEELPSLAGLNCLERINIDCCKKLQNITLPTTLIKLTVQRWGDLKSLAGIGNLTKLTELYISECPELEEIPNLAGLCCLERININSCEKLHTIQLPTTLIKLIVQRCRELQTIAGMDDLKKLTELCISECPELEEIRLFRCGKLQKITLPTTLKSLHLHDCTELKSVSDISHLKNLVQLIISRCWQLELELHLQGMSSLQNIAIDGCMTLKSVLLNKCQNLKRVSLCCYFNVARLSVWDCPELEFLNLGGESCWENICIYSCEKLDEIAGIEELQGFEAIQLLYCSNAAIQDCIATLKSVPSDYIQIIARAADGAQSNLNPTLLSEGFFCADEVSVCRQDLFKWLGSASAIIICAVVEVNSSAHRFLDRFLSNFYLREGELIITTVITDQSGQTLRKFNEQFEDVLIEHGIMKKWCAGAVKKGLVWRTLHVLHTITDKIIDKLHEKQEQITGC